MTAKLQLVAIEFASQVRAVLVLPLNLKLTSLHVLNDDEKEEITKSNKHV